MDSGINDNDSIKIKSSYIHLICQLLSDTSSYACKDIIFLSVAMCTQGVWKKAPETSCWITMNKNHFYLEII